MCITGEKEKFTASMSTVTLYQPVIMRSLISFIVVQTIYGSSGICFGQSLTLVCKGAQAFLSLRFLHYIMPQELFDRGHRKYS